VRWQPKANPLALEDFSLGQTKMISHSKLGRLKSAMPAREMQFEDSDSEESDPEIKRIKRKAGVC